MPTINIELELYRKIQQHCARENRTIKGWITEVLTRAIRLAGPPTVQPGALAHRILKWIAAQGDATCSEVEAGLGITHQSASARVHELMRAGLIVQTGERRSTGLTNATARVWRAAVTPIVMPPTCTPLFEPPPKPTMVPVARKRLPQLVDPIDDNPGDQPPFWARS